MRSGAFLLGAATPKSGDWRTVLPIDLRVLRSRPAAAVLPTGADSAESGDMGGSATVVGAASQRHLLARAAMIGLLMRHGIVGWVAVVAMLDPQSVVDHRGYWLLAAVAAWSALRLITRSLKLALLAMDVAVVIAVCLAIPLLTDDARFYLTDSAPQAIAGTAVISVAVAVPLRMSLPTTLAIALSYAVGAAEVIGWGQVGSVLAVYYFALQWTTSVLIRLMLLRVAAAVDTARESRESADAQRRIDEAVRDFDREQLSLLHDTVASTLLMVGQGVALTPARLAAQARRDLEVLEAGPWRPVDGHVDLVAALSDVTAHVRTPVHVHGRIHAWVDGDTAHAVIACCREALNNVDRHASARSCTLEIGGESISIVDDGIGFDAAAVTGHGLAHSMTARLHRIGGTVVVQSELEVGTRIEIRWPTKRSSLGERLDVLSDPDRLIARIRVIYAAALAVYAVANLLTTVPYAIAHTGTVSQLVLAVIAAACPIASMGARRLPAGVMWTLLALLALVTIAQPLSLSPSAIGTQADWVQGGIGWCVLPLVLTMPLRRGVGIVIAFWLTGAVLEVLLRGDPETWVNIGLGTGSILGVQLFALIFDGLMRGALLHVHADVEARKKLIVNTQVIHTVAEQYRRRYTDLIADVVPLLQDLSVGGTVGDDLQHRAAHQSRRLRALFASPLTDEAALTARLRNVAEANQRPGADVTVEVCGLIEEPSVNDATAILAVVERALRARPGATRIAASGGPKGLTVSVVCRGVADAPALAAQFADIENTHVVTTADTMWVVIDMPIHQKGSAAHDHTQ